MTNQVAAAVKEYGISVFALSPGGPTAIMETLATSPKVPEKLRAGARRVMSEDNTSIQESVRLLMFLLTGPADHLTGRHIRYDDPLDELAQRADDIIRDDLYTLRRHGLS